MNICTKCKHVVTTSVTGQPLLWMDFRCSSRPVLLSPERMNPVDGSTLEPLYYKEICRDKNKTGHCEEFDGGQA